MASIVQKGYRETTWDDELRTAIEYRPAVADDRQTALRQRCVESSLKNPARNQHSGSGTLSSMCSLKGLLDQERRPWLAERGILRSFLKQILKGARKAFQFHPMTANDARESIVAGWEG